MKSLEGKLAVITGGARGLGAATASLFVAEGAAVVITDIRDAEGTNFAERIGATYLHQDVADERTWDKLITRVVADHGRVDIFMNNAGIVRLAPLVDCTTEDWDRQVAVNQTAVFFGMRAIGRQMIEQGGGSIINVASVSAQQCLSETLAYSGSKAAVVAMTRVAAKELGPHGIRVNALLPGMMDTPMLDEVDPGRIQRNKLLRRLPLRRMASADEVAKAALFLASDESSFCCGETLRVDGGSAS